MSLINEALKRAREAQEPAPAPAAPRPALTPIEPLAPQNAHHSLLPLFTLGVVVLLAVICLWQWLHRDQAAHSAAESLVVNAREPSPAPTPSPAPAPTAKPAAPAAPSSAIGASETGAASTTVHDSGSSTGTVAQAASSTAVPQAPKPEPLRLQAIVYQPRRPSALIGGKTVFVGDKVGGRRVVAITPTSATLVSVNQTNVLTLSQ